MPTDQSNLSKKLNVRSKKEKDGRCRQAGETEDGSKSVRSKKWKVRRKDGD